MSDEINPNRRQPYDPDRWAAFWLRIAGIALLLGFFAPGFGLIGPGGGPYEGGSAATVEWTWSWSHLERRKPWAQLAVFLPLVLGVLWLVLAAPSAVSQRRRWLLIGSIAIVFLQTVPGTARPIPMAGPWGEVILKTLCQQSGNIALLLAAVGCHLRWRVPDLPIGRKLAGLGGTLVILFWLFLQDGWQLVRDFELASLFGPALLVLVLLGYGVCAATSALPGGRGRAWICRWIARVYLLVSLPITMVMYLQMLSGSGEGQTVQAYEALLFSLHNTGWLIGIGMTLALTLAVWLEPKAS